MQQCANNLSATSIQQLHLDRNQEHISREQIRKIRDKWSASNFVLDSNNQGSAAERLVYQLQSDPNCKYVILTASHDNHGMITIRNKSRRTGDSSEDTHSPIGTGTEVRSAAGEILRRLSIGDGTQLLMIALWASTGAIDYFAKFPSVFAFDVTMGTNSEKRPLARGTASTLTKKNIPICNIFCPSEATWVFNWIFQEGLPKILPQSLLHSIRLVLTDGDVQIYSQIDAAISSGVLPNAKHRLCSWHKVSRVAQRG